MAITKSSKLFLERMGLRTTSRGPVPTVAPLDLSIHSITLSRPLPHPDFVSRGAPPPDPDQWPEGVMPAELPPDHGPSVDPWPHGMEEE